VGFPDHIACKFWALGVLVFTGYLSARCDTLACRFKRERPARNIPNLFIEEIPDRECETCKDLDATRESAFTVLIFEPVDTMNSIYANHLAPDVIRIGTAAIDYGHAIII